MLKRKDIKFLFVLLAFIMVMVSSIQTEAASTLSLYNTKTKENIKYTGKQISYYLDGAKINMKNTPGITLDGTALAPYDELFVNSGIELDYKYDKTKGRVTLYNDNTKLIVTIGSKKATLNGKSITLPLAPVQLKYKAANVTKILVPSRFVAETFGYKYEWKSANSSVYITSPLRLYYNGKTVNYTSTLGKVTVDGKSVSVTTLPSIIINNTAMIQAKKVFNGSSIGAGYSYNSKTKTVKLTKGDTVVELKLNSPIAYVNGKSRIMDVAPVSVKNLNTNKSYIMVPGSFVASFLGYDYRWDSFTKTSVITTRVVDDNDDVVIDGPELDGEGAYPDSSKLVNWPLKDMYTYEVSQIKDKKNTNEIISQVEGSSNIYAVAKDYSYSANKETFLVYSSTPIGNITTTLNGDMLNVHVDNSITNTTTYSFGGSIVDTVSTVNQTASNSSDINFHLLNPNSTYELTLSDNKNILYVTVYKNYLSDVTIGKSGNYEYIKLTGLNPLNVELTQSGNLLLLTLPYTVNGVGDNYADTSTLETFKSVQSITVDQNQMQIILNLAGAPQYYVSKVNNTYTLSFVSSTAVSATSNLQIKLPTGINYSQVRHEDRYYEKAFSIILPGDHSAFFNQNMIAYTGNAINNVYVTYKNNETYINVNTTKLQGYKLEDKNGELFVTVGNPKDIYKNIVVLDAGHGGTDPGAMRSYNGETIKEKDINFAIIERSLKYFNSNESDIKVYLSRYNDTKVDLYERAAFAEVVGADLFVSLHMNANYNTSINGTEIYYTDSNNDYNNSGLNSKGLANIFLNLLPNMVGTATRNVRAQNYVVTRENTVPAILLELGFMSNTGDLSMMVDEYFQEDTANALYDILNIVFDSYPTGR